MMRSIFFQLALIFAISLIPDNLKSQGQGVADGSWLGTLEVGAVKLRIVFNITSDIDGKTSATMDSPDQGAKDIPMGEVRIWGDSLKIDAPIARGYYLGKILSPNSISGSWTQSGQTFKLDLEELNSKFKLNRPQEPKPPYPYIEEDVTFLNSIDGITLAGTITRPQKEGVYPAVILVTGSGTQNRDEEIFGHKPFKFIADQLTRAGVVVLRYDDRGAGKSGGNPAGATSEDFARDAYAAFHFLEDLEYTNSAACGIIGHSEGGLIAMMLAAEKRDIDFIISLAGPGTTGSTVILDQSAYISRLSNVTDSIILMNANLTSGIHKIIMQYPDQSEGIVEIENFINLFSSENGLGEDVAARISTDLINSFGGGSYNWFRFFFASDPVELLSNIKCPVLALNGELDCQVLAKKNISSIEKALKGSGNKKYRTEILPGLNHLFQNAKTGMVDEYGQIEETMEPAVTALISDWINKNFLQ